MESSPSPPEDEIKRLQRCINDLVSVLALPAIWTGGEPGHLVRTLVDVLVGMLHLDLAYVRLKDPVGEEPAEMARVGESQSPTPGPEAIGEMLNRRLGDDPRLWRPLVRGSVGDGDMAIVPFRLGLNGELGVLIAGSKRAAFPEQTERLLLSVAANQAAIGLQAARLLSEQKGLAKELDRRVAQRTAEVSAANEELRASELNLQQMTETIPEMLWSATPDGAIDYCNARLLDYTGFAAQEVMGAGWTKLLHPDDVDRAIREWMSCVTSGAPYRVEVRAFHAPDRSYRWCVTNARPLLDPDGHILKWHGTVVDMHEWKQAQEDLRNTQAELAHLTRVMAMGELTASIAHEVNQPLAGIITNASTCLRMLAADPPNIEGARETARRTIRDGNRASDVVTRLRALFSRKEPAADPVDLNEAAEEVIALTSNHLQRASISLRLELADDLPLVCGDRVQLQQVILNLIRNASDAMSSVEDRPRQVLVRTGRDEGDRVRVTVRDTGTGIDPQAVDRLFEAFYTTKSDGMGIGLSVSRSIVESHQGRLWAASNDGPGATFAFSIPRGSANARRAVRSR